MVIKKTIADTDSIHCLKPTSSNQSSVFIGYANNPDWERIWGADFDSSTVAKLLVSKTNLAKNIVAHFLETKTWFDRTTGKELNLDKKWLFDLFLKLDKFFDGDNAVVSAGLNRETSSNPRLYLKGLYGLKRDGSNEKLDLREYLFSSDEIVFENGDGCVSFIVNPAAKIPEEFFRVFGIGEIAVAGMKNSLLRVGDHFEGKDGGEFTVVECLPRVYRIRVDEIGKIRSVPKTVVAAWYEFYKAHPTVDYELKKSNGTIEHKKNVLIRDAATRPIRDLINETTIDDKYEHGYDGMLGTIARWLLDHPERKDTPESEPSNSSLPTRESLEVDRLTVALKLFQTAREETVSTGARYWVFSPGERACRWDEMREGGYAALSYERTDDLRKYIDENGLRDEFKTSTEDAGSHKNDLRALTDFLNVMKPGDYIFAKNGTKTFLGVGRVTGEYEFVADASDYKHRRKVEWFKIETVEREDQVARKTLTDVTRCGDLVRELCEAYGVEGAVNSDEGNWGCQDVRDWFAAFIPEKLKEDFAYFRSRMLWSKRVQGAIGREYAHVDELAAVMNELKESPRPIGYYASEEFAKKCPDGFGKSTATDFLMKFHPNEYISFTGNMMDALDFLGLWPKDVKRDMEVCYNELIGAATRVRNRMNDLEIGRFAEGKKPEADYLTVNEFLWWTNEHKDLIAEKAKAEKLEKDEYRPADVLSLAIQAFKANRTTWTDKLSKDKTVYECINLHVRDYFRRDHGWKIDELKSGEEKPFEAFFKDNTWMLTNGKGGWKNLSHYTDAERAEFVKWVDESIVSGPKALPEIFAKVESDFKGVTSKAATELLMKFHPDLYCLCNGPTIDALNFLRVLKEDIPEDYDYDAYMQVMGVCAYLRKRLNDAGIDRIEGEKGDPDYITVNEFLFFVSSNMDLIKEKVMKEQLKPIEANKTIKKGSRKLADAFKDDAMLQRLAAALRTKPFAILAGHSGTGKSQLVRRLAYMTCNNQKLIDEGKDKTAPGNYCMVQVKPNWHDSTDLLGYYSDLGTRHFVNTAFVQFLCKAYAYPQTPFFLCLDEMNLAPVEQYFAEYLSAVESLDEKDGIWLTDSLVEVAKEGDGKVDAGILMQIMRGAPSTEAAEWIAKHGLTIPKNLFVVGTVNMDETTCQFSRKVLDRAMTLLMNEVKFDTMGKSVDPKKEELLDEDGINFFLDGARKGMVGTDEVALLDNVNKPLKNTPFVIAYRFANEYALYEAALAKLRNAESVSSVAAEAIDHVVLMKLLPRIHGEKSVVEEIFKGKDKSGGLCAAVGDGLSKTQMEAILERKAEYLTFWP